MKNVNRLESHASSLVHLYCSFAHHDARATYPCFADLTPLLFRTGIKHARAPHLDPLSDAPLEAPARRLLVVREQAGQCTGGTACRRVFWNPIERCKHPGTNIELTRTMGVLLTPTKTRAILPAKPDPASYPAKI